MYLKKKTFNKIVIITKCFHAIHFKIFYKISRINFSIYLLKNIPIWEPWILNTFRINIKRIRVKISYIIQHQNITTLKIIKLFVIKLIFINSMIYKVFLKNFCTKDFSGLVAWGLLFKDNFCQKKENLISWLLNWIIQNFN